MTLTEQVYTQAKVMAQELAEENQSMLEAISAAAVADLQGKLRDEIGPEDCVSEFVTAAAMYALAAMSDISSMGQLEQVTAGDVTLRRGKNTAANALRYQAQMLMKPYIKMPFLFAGV